MGTWDNIRTWEMVLPPSRPSSSQLGRIKEGLAGLDRNAQVAVLGSTPEFRDLLWECGFKHIFVLEKNRTFYEEVSSIRIYSNEEIVLWGDWLETLPGNAGRFAAVLSDLTSGNVPYTRRKNFYHVVGEALVNNGLFFDKVLTHPLPHLPVDSLLEKYSNLPLNLLHINYFSCEMFFCSDLLSLKDEVDSSLFYSIIQSRARNPRIQAFLKRAELITPKGCVWWYGRSWDMLKEEYCPTLRCLSVDNDDAESPYYGRLKFFTFVRER